MSLAPSPSAGCDESCRCRSAARHDPMCACQLYPIGAFCPYCTPRAVFRAAPAEKTRAELNADDAARLESVYQTASRSIAVGTGKMAPQAGTPPEVPAVRQKRKRRTKQEMEIVRAEAKARIELARERVTPDWLVGADQDMEDFAASLRGTNE